MRTSKVRARKFSSTVGKILMALVFVSMIGAISMAPAFGKDHDRRHGYYKHGRYYEHGGRVYRSPPRYYGPVYAPPPVVYEPYPYQSPGISLFFPIYIR
jgi:hypothetical protein